MDLQLKDKSVIVTGGAKGIWIGDLQRHFSEDRCQSMYGSERMKRPCQEVRAQVGQPGSLYRNPM